MNMINCLPFFNHKYEMSLKILQITARVAAILDLCKLTIVPGLGFLFICHKAHNSEQKKPGIITIAICGGSFHNLTVLYRRGRDCLRGRELDYNA